MQRSINNAALISLVTLSASRTAAPDLAANAESAETLRKDEPAADEIANC